MGTNKNDTLVTVSITTRDRIKELAEKKERTMKWVFEKAMQEYLDKHNLKISLQQ